MKGFIQTVCGRIDPSSAGAALMHEHILVDVAPPGIPENEKTGKVITLENVWDINYHWCGYPGNSRLESEEVAVRELTDLKKSGISTVVELSSAGLKRNPQGLERISREAGINIVMGCGYYTEPYLDADVKDKTADVMASEIISDIRSGVHETGIRAGIIGEIGCSGSWTDLEKQVMEAAVTAQIETGASINVHPHRSPDAPAEIVGFIRERGGDPERTIISHIDRTIFDFSTLFELADSGCVIEYDFFGIESSYYPFQPQIDLPNDGMRLKAVRSLIERGHLDQIVISHDICTKTRLRSFGGHGYTHISDNVVPLMKIKNFSDEEIRSILVRNPVRLLTMV